MAYVDPLCCLRIVCVLWSCRPFVLAAVPVTVASHERATSIGVVSRKQPAMRPVRVGERFPLSPQVAAVG